MNNIKRILVANRGEIVLRIKQACDRLGVKVVSIYAEDDKDLPHANLEESYCLGRGNLSDTYLNGGKIIKIAQEAGCDAIHPGYGFLSENASFANEIISNGLIFIGPKSDSINLMGDKIQSKITAEKFNLPLIPGFLLDERSESDIKEQCEKIGFPVLIKASAGGGGKGMRIVHSADEFAMALGTVKREALNAFGNDQVLIEKYIMNPRHIEVQVMSDSHGNHRHIFERECSAQRRYQKVIEEAPAQNLKDETKERLYKASLDLIEGINYLGAGTIEYIVDIDENIYFLEMNTRLQVEHPVSEEISGLDLVEWQIRIAQGEKINFSQPVQPIGHAIECRIYAEDTRNGFLPTTGRLIDIGEVQFDDTRFDTGYLVGNEIGINYDPMIAKLIVRGDSKDECIEKALIELSELTFAGLKTNRDFLISLLQDSSFINSVLSTKYIEENADFIQRKSNECMARLLALNFMSESESISSDWESPWVGLEDKWL